MISTLGNAEKSIGRDSEKLFDGKEGGSREKGHAFMQPTLVAPLIPKHRFEFLFLSDGRKFAVCENCRIRVELSSSTDVLTQLKSACNRAG